MSTKIKSNTGRTRKNTTLVKCHKCKKNVEARETAQCMMCENRFEFECAGFPEKVYRMMDQKSKNQWKCKTCIPKPKETVTPNTPELVTRHFSAYAAEHSPCTPQVTMRSKIRNNFPGNVSTDLTSSDDENRSLSSTLLMNRSCPDLTINVHEELAQVKHELATVQGKLESAEEEISNQLSEIFSQKKEIEMYKSKIAYLTRLSLSSPAIGNHSPSPLRTRNQTKTRDQNPSPALTSKSPDAEIIIKLKSQIKSLEIKLNEANKEIEKLHNKLELLDKNLSSYQLQDETQSSEILKHPRQDFHIPYSRNCNKRRGKLCIISTDDYKNVLLSLEKIKCEYNYCHYKMPGCGIKHQLENIESKLMGFTKNDFCIILLGDKDFNKSNDLKALITYIRNILVNISYTNILICLPTYSCNYYANIFNWRVERFNNLLYQDNLKYEYCFIIDSNLNLNYNTTMFNRYTGNLNNFGLKTLLLLALENINAITAWQRTPASSKQTDGSLRSRKGTIPFYFSVVDKNKNLFRA